MEAGAETENWKEKWEGIIGAGTGDLQNLLKNDPPASNLHYVWLLEILQGASYDYARREAFRNIIYDHLDQSATEVLRPRVEQQAEEDYDYDPVQPGQNVQNKVSVFGVLQVAMLRASKLETPGSREVMRHIWQSRREALLDCPILAHECVYHNFSFMLETIVKHINKCVEGGHPELMRHVFFSRAHTGYTAFEWAFWKADLEALNFLSQCDWTLEMFDRSDQRPNAGTRGLTPLHIAAAVAGMKVQRERRERTVQVIKNTVAKFPLALCAHSTEGEPAYSFVLKEIKKHEKDERAKELLDEIALFMRESIFKRLPDVEHVSKALYGVGGNFPCIPGKVSILTRQQVPVSLLCCNRRSLTDDYETRSSSSICRTSTKTHITFRSLWTTSLNTRLSRTRTMT